MKKRPFKIIKLNAFPYDVMVSFGNTPEEIEAELKKYDIKLDEEHKGWIRKTPLAHTIRLPNNAVLMHFLKEPTQGIIAHESFHAVWAIMDTMGAAPSDDSEEVYAYLIEYIVDQIGE